MSRKHRALLNVFALALALGFTALAPARAAQEQQTDPPRRPQGPAASPVIKLPRGAGGEQTQQTSTPKEGNAARASNAAPAKWEYCAINGFVAHGKGLNGYSYWAVVRYFPNTTEEVEGENEEDALANAFVKLGDEGWELAAVRTEVRVTEGSGGSTTAYFFKRRKRQ